VRNEDADEGVQDCWGQSICLIKRGAGYNAYPESPEDGCFWHYVTFDTGLGDGSGAFKDKYCEGILSNYGGSYLETKRIGRGEGLYDVEGLTILGAVDPGHSLHMQQACI
jgi:hypothetical protein